MILYTLLMKINYGCNIRKYTDANRSHLGQLIYIDN
nr:MAG TPA: hypothetical protein [Caudoviricetes sp.]